MRELCLRPLSGRNGDWFRCGEERGLVEVVVVVVVGQGGRRLCWRIMFVDRAARRARVLYRRPHRGWRQQWRRHVDTDENRNRHCLRQLVSGHSFMHDYNDAERELPQPIKVVVTAPSSPEIQQPSPKIANILATNPRISLNTDYAMQPPVAGGSTVNSVTNDIPNSHRFPPSHFDELLASSDLPDPGPAYFQARRALWLTPMGTPSSAVHQSRPLHPTLQALLEGPTEALYEESNWNGGVGKICSRLLSGESLSNRLPLRHVVRVHLQHHSIATEHSVVHQAKLLHANWVLSDLWPKGQVVPSSDEDVSGKVENSSGKVK